MARKSDDGLGLEKTINVRVSAEAHELVRRHAKRAGLEPSTWVRVTLYRAIGLVDDK